MPQATMGGSGSVRRLIAVAFLLTAILYLLFFHFTSEVMSRSGREPWTEFASYQQEVQTAGERGQNVEFHYGDVPDYAATEAVSFARGYFLASYLEYPKRVYVGTDQQVINSPDQLLNADRLPPLAWLHAHQVSALYIYYGGTLIPHLRAINVP